LCHYRLGFQTYSKCLEEIENEVKDYGNREPDLDPVQILHGLLGSHFKGGDFYVNRELEH